MKRRLIFMAILFIFLTSTCSAFEPPPYIAVTKPTPGRTFIIDAAGSGDYLTFSAADSSLTILVSDNISVDGLRYMDVI